MQPEGSLSPSVPILSHMIQFMPLQRTSLRSILLLSFHLRLDLSSGLFPSGFPTKTLYASLLSPVRTNVAQ